MNFDLQGNIMDIVFYLTQLGDNKGANIGKPRVVLVGNVLSL